MNATNLVDALEDAAQAYVQQQPLDDALNAGLDKVLITRLVTREELKTILEEYKADGASPEEIDETLGKYGLSCDDIRN
jgi:hypothetical protein